MMRIVAAKQVGDLSYFVAPISTLGEIIKTNHINRSKHPEYNPRTGKKQHYVSFSRSMTAAAIRNNDRWRFGLILDGDKLSEHYHIEPISFAGVSLNRGTLRVKELTSYDDGSCKLRLVNWPIMEISPETFDYIEKRILAQSEKFNTEHKLTVQDGGKRRVQGRMIVKKYVYNVPHGDSCYILSDVNDIPHEIIEFLTKSESTNEYEERIWTNDPFIDIRGCIKGIILPKDEVFDFETEENNSIVVEMREILDSEYSNYKVMYYH